MKTISRYLLALLAIAFLHKNIHAQTGNVAIGPNAPDASAALDVQATNKGVLLPRLTTAERTAIATPATGLMVFDTDEKSFFYFEGTKWFCIGVPTDGKANELLQSNAAGVASWDSLSAASLLGSPVSEDYSCSRLLGTLSVVDGPQDIVISGNYAYITATWSGQLKIIDISSPTAPFVVGELAIGLYPIEVAVSGNYAFVTVYGYNSLNAVDISDPVNPTVVGTVSTGNAPSPITIAGNHAYVANYYDDNLQVIDISDPTNMTVVGSVGTGSQPKSVAISGNYAYVTNYGDNTLQAIDISTLASPMVVGSVGTGNRPNSVTASGAYVFVANYLGNSFQVIDVADPMNPTVVATLPAGINPIEVRVVGGKAYVINSGSDNIYVFDISDPVNPKQVGAILSGVTPFGLAESSGDLYVINHIGNNIQIIQPDKCQQVLGFDSGTGEMYAAPTQWKRSGGNIYNVNSGKVGIGTTNPANKLDVEGGLAVGSTYSGTTTAPSNGAIIEGKVGIGITIPSVPLEVFNPTLNSTIGKFTSSSGWGEMHIGTINELISLGANDAYDYGFIGTMNPIDFSIRTNNTARLNIDGPTGNVGIGTTSPQAPLHVTGASGVNSGTDIKYFNHTATNITSASNWQGQTAILANGNICATAAFIAGASFNFSDARIKHIIGRSDGAEDLARLNQIEITRYTHIDTIGKGNAVQTKVIAQQLEQVMPEAVSYTRAFIPDVMQVVESIDFQENKLTVSLTKPHSLKAGDHVKCIDEKGQELFVDVLAAPNENSIVFKTDQRPTQLFIYGKQVDDFHIVDYDAIAMLNVSATQELAKRLAASEQSVVQLKAEVAALKSQLSEMDALKRQVAQLAAALQSPDFTTQIVKSK